LCGIPVVCDFRSIDVGLGGQGAPLVPAAERELFSEYAACLNLGGICNISFPGKNTLGYDIAPCNQLLNLISRRMGIAFDEGGRIAASGRAISILKAELDCLPYYQKQTPKSLSNEMVAETWIPLLESCKEKPADILHTLCLHIAARIAAALPPTGGRMLVSGGGAHHLFLMDEIQKACGSKWQINGDDANLSDCKEALCFAWLGLKRILNEVNVIHSVTGSDRDSVSGALYGMILLN
jgi:anhydro-N-acetylmuramic acid kinase